MSSTELTIIIPVYNEARTLQKVISDWHTEADRLGIRHLIHILDDDSTDGSFEQTEAWAQKESWLRITRRPHAGHGPAIRHGYESADSTWIFQVDSDDEIDTSAFAELWAHRDAFDLLIGYRSTPRLSRLRGFVAATARRSVNLLFGKTARDVNCPFRLVRTALLQRALPRIPVMAFAPNVLMAGLAAADGWRIYEAPVICRYEQYRPSYLRNMQLAKAASRAFRDLLQTALHARTGAHEKPDR
ncbi:MAG: glycosyltransferase family 2 protein [Lentisphaerota bacterium]